MDHGQGVMGAPGSPAPVRPTGEGERIDAIDVLRGVAVLGILAMNIQGFSMPDAGYMNPASLPTLVPFEGANRWVYAVVHALFDMKMMSIFSMLFGAGVVLYASRAGDDAAALRATRVRWFVRCGWLLLIGIVHAFFVWHGDILMLYALCGLLFLWWARQLPAALLIGIGAGAIVFAAVLWASMGMFVVKPVVDPEWAATLGYSEEMVASMQGDLADLVPTAAQVDETVQRFRGGYASVQGERSRLAMGNLTGMIPFWGLWHTGGLMLIGIALMKLRVLTGERSARFYSSMAMTGYAVGLPLVLAGLALNFRNGFEPAFVFVVGLRFNEFGSIAVALGHIGLVMWAVKSGGLRTAQRALGAVGRMALTNYLAQSVIATLVFYGYGLGMYGHLQRPAQLGVVLMIWAAQLAWSPLWLARFRYGPAEWAWRCLTYGRLLRIAR